MIYSLYLVYEACKYSRLNGSLSLVCKSPDLSKPEEERKGEEEREEGPWCRRALHPGARGCYTRVRGGATPGCEGVGRGAAALGIRGWSSATTNVV